MHRILALVIPLVLVGGVACDDTTTTTADQAGAGGESSVETPVEWMEAACPILQTWVADGLNAAMDTAFGAAGEALEEGPEGARDAILAGVEAQISAARAAVDGLNALGPGPTDNGREVLDLLKLAPDTALAAYTKTRDAIAALDLSDLAAAEATMLEIEAELEAAGRAAEDAVAQLPEDFGAGYPACLPI